MAKAKKQRTSTSTILAKLSPEERVERAKKLAYNHWKASLIKEKKWKSRDKYKGALRKLQTQYVNKESSSAPQVVAEAEGTVTRIEDLGIGATLSVIGQRLEKIRAEEKTLIERAKSLFTTAPAK